MGDNDIRRMLDGYIRERVMEGTGELSLYEWNCIVEDYVCHVPASRCAAAMKMRREEVEKLYEIFSIHVVTTSLHSYLYSA
ncbi:MAG: hypothetical protein ACI32N_08150 [Bulleidia sp.]